MDVSRMLAIYASYGFGDAPTQDLVDMTNEVYHDVCDLEPWPFLEATIDLTFDGSTGIPTNFPTNVRAVTSISDLITGTTLDWIRLDEHMRYHTSNLTYQANPIYFFWEADQMQVWPIPSASTSVNNLRMKHLIHEPDLTSGTLSASILLPSRHHWAIVYGVLSMLYLEEDDQTQSDYFLNRMDRKVERMRADLWQKQFVRADTIDTLDDDWDFYGGLYGSPGLGSGI